MASTYEVGSGSGSRLPTPVLVVAGVSTLVAMSVSAMSIILQFKSYRKPILQRMVVRIMLMVPLYAISSLISLFSLEAAFVIDAIRDIYEAFVIYCFFELLLAYLGGERSLLILLHGRPPKEPLFPASIFKREIDVSDPYTFLFLKRGILQYVQVKPMLAAATLILKALGKYNDGDFRANSGYLYVTVVYNISICVALYCLAMFWVCVNEDLKPFRPVPKFLCVKGILFFSFWQSVAISIFVAAHVIIQLGPYTDAEHISVGLNDILICVEMPFFAIAHNYAFSYKDFISPDISYVARMPFWYALRDAFGLRDLVENMKSTLRGEGMDYREFEPAEGLMHQGAGRDRRIRAGLRYSKGGQRKYWLPQANEEPTSRTERAVNRAITKVAGRDQAEGLHAPLLSSQAENVVHLAPDLHHDSDDGNGVWEHGGGSGSGDAGPEDGFELPFGDLDDFDEELFEHSKAYIFGDYNYPCIDVSSEQARVAIWTEEERVLRDERGAWFSPIRGAKGRLALQGREGPAWEGYGAVGNTVQPSRQRTGSSRYFHTKGGQRVIDYEEDRVASVDENDADDSAVKLRWTKVHGQDVGSPAGPTSRLSGSRTLLHSNTKISPQGHVADAKLPGRPSPVPSLTGSNVQGSGSSGGSPANRVRPSPIISRVNSRDSRGGSRGSPILSPDAVDLVVEDAMTAEHEQVRERRKGEPATRAHGLRKVYRRGSEVEGHDGRTTKGEVGVGADEGRVATGGQILHEIETHDQGDKQQRRLSQESPVWHPDSPEGVVARAESPPKHARLSPNYSYDTEHNNPWA